MDINEVARLAGVSRATVSRYFNNGYVSQEKRDAIARVIKKTGYAPSQHAKTLRTGKTNVVATIIPKINSASVSRMVAGMTPVLNEAGYQLLLANTNNDEQREIDFLRLFAEQGQVDGIILRATTFTPGHEEAFAELQLPLVILDQSIEGQACVYQDDYQASRAVTELALARGERPAFIGVFDEDVSAGHMRRQGFLDVCAARGIELPEGALQVADFTVDSGYTCAEAILDAYPEVDTIVCATDAIAYGALTCLREYGRRVPEDVQVTGIGDSELSQIITPTLTTVHHHYKTSGTEAARMLVDLLNGSTSAVRQLKMGFEVVARNSIR